MQSHSEQASAAIKQINEGVERLSEKVDYMRQEQIEMESSQDTIHRDMEKLKTGKSLYVDIAREEEMNSGEARERSVTTQSLETLKGHRSEQPVKERCPTPIKNGSYLLNSGDERQTQKAFTNTTISNVSTNRDRRWSEERDSMRDDPTIYQ